MLLGLKVHTVLGLRRGWEGEKEEVREEGEGETAICRNKQGLKILTNK